MVDSLILSLLLTISFDSLLGLVCVVTVSVVLIKLLGAKDCSGTLGRHY